MTLPVVPGPFSFLREAGQEAGSIIDASTQARLRDEEIERREETEFMNRLAVFSQMFGSDVLKDPNVQAGVRRVLKIPGSSEFNVSPLITSAEEVAATTAVPQAQAELAGTVAGTEASRAATAASEAVTERSEALLPGDIKQQAATTGATEAGTRQATAAAIGQEINNTIAAATENTQIQAILAQNAATVEEANTRVELFKEAQNLLTSDPDTARLAARSAMGLGQIDLEMFRLRRAALASRDANAPELQALKAVSNVLESTNKLALDMKQQYSICLANASQTSKSPEEGLEECAPLNVTPEMQQQILATQLSVQADQLGVTVAQMMQSARGAQGLVSDTDVGIGQEGVAEFEKVAVEEVQNLMGIPAGPERETAIREARAQLATSRPIARQIFEAVLQQALTFGISPSAPGGARESTREKAERAERERKEREGN